MSAKAQPDELDEALRGMRGLWVLMLLVPFGYLLVGLWLGRQLHADLPRLESALPGLMALGTAIAGACLYGALRLRRGVRPGPPPWLVLKMAIRQQRNAGGNLPAAVAIYQAALTLQLALAEGIALVGMVLHLFGAPSMTLLLFTNVSVALMVLLRPRLALLKPEKTAN